MLYLESIKNKKYNITDISSSKLISRNPSGPFTTSTLQQTASSKLRFWSISNNANCSKAISRN